MKKIISVIMSVFMKLSMSACSSLSNEEKAFTGLWNATYVEMQGVLESVPSAYCAFEVKEDKTATLSTVDEKGRVMNEQLAWEYKETTEGGMYVFDVTNTSGGVLTTVYSPEGNRVVMFTSETTSILFEKVGE